MILRVAVDKPESLEALRKKISVIDGVKSIKPANNQSS